MGKNHKKSGISLISALLILITATFFKKSQILSTQIEFAKVNCLPITFSSFECSATSKLCPEAMSVLQIALYVENHLEWVDPILK